MRKLLVFAVLVLALSLAATAQDVPKAEVYGGFSLLHIDTRGAAGLLPPGFSVVNNYPGLEAALQLNASKWLGFKADFSGHLRTPVSGTGLPAGIPSAHFFNFLFGPVVSHRADRATAFAHALFGFNRASIGSSAFTGAGGADNAFAMALGGGVDLNMGRSFALRIIQVDYLLTRHNVNAINPTVGNNQNNVRFGAGIVFRFGGGY